MRRIIAFLLFFIMLASISACQTGKPEADDTGSAADLRFSQPYISYVGKTQREMLDAGIVTEEAYDMGDRLHIVRREPVSIDGCAYQVVLGYDITVTDFDLAAYEADPAEAEKAVLYSARFTCSDKIEARHVEKLRNAMCQAYGKQYRNEYLYYSHQDLEAYLKDPAGSGSYTDIWVVSEKPEYPPVRGWEPNYIVVYITVTAEDSGTEIVIQYRLMDELSNVPDVYV